MGSFAVILRAGVLGAVLTVLAGGAGRAAEGELILNRDVDVRLNPWAEAPAVAKLERGQTVTMLGSPRGSGFAWIGRAGRSLGFVPLDSLDPIWAPRPAAEQVALVDDRVLDGAGRLPGTHVLSRAVGKGKQALARGAVVDVTAVDAKSAEVSLGGGKRTRVPIEALQPIIGTRQGNSGLSGQAPAYYVSKLGSYLSPVEANAAWQGPSGLLAQLYPESRVFVYPSVEAGVLSYALAFGLFDRAGAERACMAAAQRGRDCWLVQVNLY